jgi:FMN phosphatase YigB (HAD superfamily)/DNA-binding XRE family transcriptional regulator
MIRPMDEVGLGRLLQSARKKAGLTQQELCHRAGLSYSTLAKIERGAIKAPSIFTIQSIAAALGTNLNDLMGDFGPKPSAAATKMISKSGVRFVYFDINGCLVRFFHRAFTKMAEDTGASADQIETTFWHYNDAVCSGEMSLPEFNKILSETFEHPGMDWAAYYLEAIDPIQEMRELVTWAAEHYYVGLLSNIMPGLVDTMISRGILPQIPYDQIIDSSVVGAIKPDEQIFRIATERSGVNPTEILLVDDARPNIMAAEKMGWKVLWFDDYRPDESVARVRSALEPESV